MSKRRTEAISQAADIQSILTRSWEGGGLSSIVVCPLRNAVQSVNGGDVNGEGYNFLTHCCQPFLFTVS